jgi:hypothetical protein
MDDGVLFFVPSVALRRRFTFCNASFESLGQRQEYKPGTATTTSCQKKWAKLIYTHMLAKCMLSLCSSIMFEELFVVLFHFIIFMGFRNYFLCGAIGWPIIHKNNDFSLAFAAHF